MKKKKNYKPLVYLVLCFFCVCTLIPCVLIVITSLRTTQEIVKERLVRKYHYSPLGELY